jgi:hypothetical protein
MFFVGLFARNGLVFVVLVLRVNYIILLIDLARPLNRVKQRIIRI